MAGAAVAAGVFCRAQRSGLRGAHKMRVKLGCALLPRAGAFCSRRGRLLLLERRSLLRPPVVRLVSSMSGSSFSVFAGFACTLGAGAAFFSGFAFFASAFAGFGCFAAGFSAGSAAAALGFCRAPAGAHRRGHAVPRVAAHHGILRRFSFSMPARYSCSSGAQKLTAVPSAPARAVRPMRCT